jgi:hypothetical protein
MPSLVSTAVKGKVGAEEEPAFRSFRSTSVEEKRSIIRDVVSDAPHVFYIILGYLSEKSFFPLDVYIPLQVVLALLLVVVKSRTFLLKVIGLS